MIPDDPTMVKHYFLDKVFFKRIKLPAGASVTTHRHKYDHGMVVAMGHVELTLGRKVVNKFAGDLIEIKAGKNHGIKAMTDSCLFCVHAIPEDLQDESGIDSVLIEG